MTLRAPPSRIPLLTLAAMLLVATSTHAGPLADALLNSQNFKVRVKAATELGKTQDPQGVAALMRALGDEVPLVRAASANSLGQLQAREALPKICGLRGDADAFVQTTVGRALAAFGGESACSATPMNKIFVEFEVLGSDDKLRRLVESQLLERAAKDDRILLGRSMDGTTGALGANPRDEVSAGRMTGAAMTVNVSAGVNRGSGSTRIQCQLGQAFYELRDKRLLKGSASPSNAEIDLGSSSVTEAAANAQVQECLAALVPIIYGNFGEYLKGVKR